MHFKWENPCRIRHQIEKIKSRDEEKISDESKWKRIETEFENSPCILNYFFVTSLRFVDILQGHQIC